MAKHGRGSAKVEAILKKELAGGSFSVGQYLPGVRELGRKHGVSPETVRRALKHLETEHWVTTHARHGFKVTGQANDPHRAAPFAYVCGDQPDDSWGGIVGVRLAALNVAANHRGWSTLGVPAAQRSAKAVIDQLLASRVSGVILDASDEKLHAAVQKLGIPAVMADTWISGSRFDAVIQDNFGGAMQAVAYLVERGHSRIAWVGTAAGIQGLERWAGVMAGLRRFNLFMPADFMVSSDDGPGIRALLSRPDRPSGVVAPWASAASTVLHAGMELGLRPGSDLEVVGWCPEEFYSQTRDMLPPGHMIPQIVWSIRDMAEACIARLAERRAHPDLHTIRLNVETRLRMPDDNQEGASA